MASSPSLLFLLTALLLCNLTPNLATSTSTTHDRTSPLSLPSPPSNLPPSSAESRLEHSNVDLATSTSHSTSPPLPLPSQPSELPPVSPPSRVEDFVVDPQFIPFDFGSFNSRLSFPAHGGNDVASDGGNDVAASDGVNYVDSSFGDFGTSYSPLSFPAHENDVTSPSTISSSDVLALLLTYGLGGFTALLIVVLIWALCLRNRAPAGPAIAIAVASVAGAGLAGINSVQAWVNNFRGVIGDAAVAPLENNVAGAANPAAQGSFFRRCAQAVGGLFALGGVLRAGGNHNQPLLQQDIDLEAGELHRAEEASGEIEPAQVEEIEPANEEEMEPAHVEEVEPALDAAGGEQNQPLLVARSRL